MSNIAIVAIPSKTDQVWGISSEKVPHMTLIHLGEALPKTDFQKVADWIEHVADTMLHPFWMEVSERSTLGKKDADVLFFKPDEDSSIQLFRKYLLANSAVREAFETVDQFEGWTPHLTLGYPETPAKKTAFDHEFYGVSFNKIALWVGDYEGPEFQLKEQEDMAIAMSEEAEEFLAHFGVKGMKWGQRKTESTVSGPKTTAAWRKSLQNKETIKKIISDSEPGYRKDLGKINAKYGGKIDKSTAKAYNSEVYASTLNRLDQSAAKIGGTSPNGKYRMTARVNPSGKTIILEQVPVGANMRVEAVLEQASLSESSMVIATLRLVKGLDGLFTGAIEMVDDELAQSDLDELDAFLAHYGVQGMRWGLTRNRVQLADARKAGLSKVHQQGRTIADDKSVVRTKVRNPEKRRDTKAEWRAKVTDKKTVDQILAKATPRIEKDLADLKATTKGRTMTYAQRNNYRRQAQDIINTNLDVAATSISGLSPGRNPITVRAAMTITDGKLKMRIKPTQRAQSAAEKASRLNSSEDSGGEGGILEQSSLSGKIPEEGLLYNVLTDEAGYITGFEVVDENSGLAQSDLDELDTFLAHYGVPGMRWGQRKSAAERRADRTARVQSRAEKSIARSEQYTARATAKAAAAKAKTETAKAKTEAATAKLETKLAKEDTKLAKTEARTGKDDPSNGRISDRDSGVVGNSNRQAKNLRDAAIKDVRTLDDQTLKAYTERLNTEKKLKDTIKQDQAPGRTATKKLIADAGKDVAKTALIGLGSMAVYYALAKVGAKKGRNDEPLIDFEGMGSTTTKGKSNTKDAFTTAAKEAAKRKAAADAAAKAAADAASSWKPPKSKYPNAIPITGRASPNTNPPPPSGYRKKPGFDPDNWDLRPGKKP